jgi:Ras family.
MLVGNKFDLVEKNPDKREVSVEQAENFAKQEGLLFIETSAVTSVKVKEAFEMLLEEIYKNSRTKNAKRGDHGENLNPMAEAPKNSSCCS